LTRALALELLLAKAKCAVIVERIILKSIAKITVATEAMASRVTAVLRQIIGKTIRMAINRGVASAQSKRHRGDHY